MHACVYNASMQMWHHNKFKVDSTDSHDIHAYNDIVMYVIYIIVWGIYTFYIMVDYAGLYIFMVIVCEGTGYCSARVFTLNMHIYFLIIYHHSLQYIPPLNCIVGQQGEDDSTSPTCPWCCRVYSGCMPADV